MKNTFFLQGEVQGVKATAVKLVDLFHVGGHPDVDTTVTEVASLFNDRAMDIVFNAMEMGAKYAITHQSRGFKATVCEALDLVLANEADLVAERFINQGGLEGINKLSLAPAVKDYVSGVFSKAMEGKEVPATNLIPQTEENVQMVTISGVNVTEKQVINMMGAQGLIIGNAIATKLGDGVVKGFEVTKGGTFVLVKVADEIKKFMADKLVNVIVQPSTYVAADQEDNAHIDQELGDEIAALMNPGSIPWEGVSRDRVNEAIQQGMGVYLPDMDAEVSEEEAFNAAEDARAAERAAWVADQRKGATEASSSDAAKAILAMAANLKVGGATQAPKSQPSQSVAPKAVVPAAKPQAQQQTSVRVPQVQNQSNGGNVQMSNQTQDRPVQGVAGNKAARTAGAQASTPARAPRGGAAGKTSVRLPGASAPAVSTGRGGAVRIGAGAPVVGAAPARKGLALKAEAPIQGRGTFAGQPWYMSEERYPTVVSGEEFEEVRKNEALGITHAIFWQPEVYNARFNRDTRESELAILQVFIGDVVVNEYGRVDAGLSIEFRLNYSMKADAKSPWYCNNITFMEGKNGNRGRFHYTVGNKSDRYAVVVEESGHVRMATENDFKVNKAAVQYVGEGTWKNNRIYGVDISEAFIAQVMRWAQFGWECMNEEDAE